MRRLRALSVGAGVWLGGAPASAQEGGLARDLHGEAPPAPTGDPSRPLTVVAPYAWEARTLAVGALAEFADQVAVEYQQLAPGAQPVVQPLLGQFAAVNLSAAWGWGRRAGLEFTVPVVAYADTDRGFGPGLGDPRIRVPIDVVRGRVALAAIPTVTLGVGSSQRYVGGTTSAGALVAGTWTTNPMRFDASVGAAWANADQLPTQRLGGLRIPAGVAAGLGLVRDAVWLRAELRSNWEPRASVTVDGTSAALWTSEALLSVSGRWGGAGNLVAGAGTAVGGGPGAARVRAFAGGAHRWAWGEAADEADPPIRLRVVDPAGGPVVGARILADGVEVGRTGGDGAWTGAREALWPRVVQVEAADWLPAVVAAPAKGAVDVDVALAPEVFPLAVRVTDVAGAPLGAELVATRVDGDGAAAGAEPSRGAPGELVLDEGTWRVEVLAAGSAPQTRTVRVERGRRTSGFDVVLAPPAGPASLTMDVVDADGAPVAGAQVLIDGVPIGTTTNGAAQVDGLAVGDHRIEVRHEAYTFAAAEVPAGTDRVQVVLQRVPGSVRVVAIDGATRRPVADAAVRFIGPSRLAAAPLGPHGERVTVLGPGAWDVLVTSPTFGAQRRQIQVVADDYVMQTVEVALLAPESGLVDLRVQVVDSDGAPVDHAEVVLGGTSVGTTGTGGTVALTGLDAGARDLVVRGEWLREAPPRSVDLVDGVNEVVVWARWVAGAIEVRAVGPAGPLTDATVRAVGEGAPGAVPLGADGVERLVLPPGEWTLIVTSPTYGAQRQSVSIAADSDRLHIVDVLLRPPEGGLAELAVRAVDPEGAPVAGAAVTLDGVTLGRTGPDGSLLVEQLSTGGRAFTVTSDLFVPVSRDLRLLEGRTDVEERLQWAPGVVRVAVRDGEAPSRDAVVRFLGGAGVRPAPVDDAGTRTVRLEPGLWQALAVSPTAGVGHTSFTVPVDAADRLDVAIDLGARAEGVAELAVRVIDPDGSPVEGAAVTVGGVTLGSTGPGGLLVIPALTPGDTVLGVVADGFEADARPVALQSGPQERVIVVPWLTRPVEVRIVDAEGRPVAAEVSWRGPADVPPVATGADGVARASLRPGAWEVIASSAALGPARRALKVDDGPASVELRLGAAQVEVSAALIAIREQVLFDVDRAELRDGGGEVLDQVASALLGVGPLVRVEVQGHTDATGTPAYNQELSQARAEAVLAALVARGVPPELLVARGYGPQRPLGDNRTPAGRSANRRVQFEIVERGVEP